MGTRNLTKVVDKDGITRVAQYGQWDGYPEYTGTRILEFIKEHKMIDKIEQSLVKARFITDDEVDEYSKAYTNDNGMMTFENSDVFSTMYPSLTRDTGCDILRVLIYSNGPIPLVDNSDFEQDELFCEGVYELNYKTRQFITKYNGIGVALSFEGLDTAENYLASFKKPLTNVA
jgi:hypothetical protein